MPDSSNQSLALSGRSEANTNGGSAWNQYKQVALTDVRRPFASPLGWALSMMFFFGGPGFLLSLKSGNRLDFAAGPIQLPILLAMALFGMFIFHVKSQFADARAHLTPNFRRVHATVAVAVAFLLTVALPAVVIWLADLRSIGLIALIVFLFGAILCAVVLHSNLLSWLLTLGFFASYAEPARKFVWQLLSGQFEPQAVALLALGAAFVLLGGVRLVGLTEEMPAYQPAICVGRAARCTTGPGPTGARAFPSAWQERVMENHMARWTSHARRATRSWWSRVCRWQAGMPSTWSSFLIVFFALVLFSILTTGQNGQNLIYPMVMVFSFLPPLMVWTVFRRSRLPMLAHELLLPVDRQSFVRQVGVAMVLRQIQLWAGMSIGITVWALLLGRQTVSLTNLTVLLGVLALLQPWFFGVGAWFVRYRTLGVQMAGFVLAQQVSLISFVFCAEAGPLSPWRYAALPLAAIAAILGLVFAYFAYRCWLVADID
jgi:hypothetical protein